MFAEVHDLDTCLLQSIEIKVRRSRWHLSVEQTVKMVQYNVTYRIRTSLSDFKK